MKNLLVLIYTVIFCSCTGNFRFYYIEQNDIPIQNSRKLGILGIHLTDIRKPVYGAETDGKICINTENNYIHDSTSQQVTDIFGKYLLRSGLFSSFYTDSSTRTDYILSANIAKIEGSQKISTAKLIGMHFGIVGAVATAWDKTEVLVTIEFQEINLLDVATNSLLLRIPSFERIYHDRMYADASCSCVYINVNTLLNRFICELISDIENRFRNPRDFIRENFDPNLRHSKIVLTNGNTGNGYIKAIDKNYIIYYKQQGDPLIRLKKEYVKFIITGNDTIYSQE